MENLFLQGLKDETNYTYTENGALTHRSTGTKLYDLFAMGAAMRNRPVEDIIRLFRAAFAENPVYALKCLFYIRDVRGGQGERRFFRICIKDLAMDGQATKMRELLPLIPEYGRWDDLYAFVDTPVEAAMFDLIRNQLRLDLISKTPSLLAKWLKSENASNAETIALAVKTRKALKMTPKQYRQALSYLRNKINIVERLMSENRWNEIEFDKIPSKAGLIYRNAFARRDIIKEKYKNFAEDKNTKVNAGTLYPYEVVEKALHGYHWWLGGFQDTLSETERAMINKYWDNLADYFTGKTFNGLAVVDTSGSMMGTPINVAISLGLYCADKASGPFANHYISFSSRPQLIKVEGFDFVDKVHNIYRTNLCENTNIEATFDLVLNTAINNRLSQRDLPENLIVISDMEFDRMRTSSSTNHETLMERISHKWEAAGYKMPKLVFWNVDARQDNIPMRDANGITFVSGFSPVIFEQIMTGKTAQDLMFDVLDSERYAAIK